MSRILQQNAENNRRLCCFMTGISEMLRNLLIETPLQVITSDSETLNRLK